jgi:hypothetical protein
MKKKALNFYKIWGKKIALTPYVDYPNFWNESGHC